MHVRNLVLFVLVALSFALPASSQSVIFSEYVEGSSFNKALELYNGSNSAISLDGYLVNFYFNGNITPSSSVDLTGQTIGPDDVLVVANPSAEAAILAVTDVFDAAVNFNGNDAVALVTALGPRRGLQFIDVIGRIGEDPGSEWGSGDASTQDNTIRRKGMICAGDTDGSNPFDPSLEWDGFPQDTFNGLGAHAGKCEPVPVVEATWGGVKSTYREGTSD